MSFLNVVKNGLKSIRRRDFEVACKAAREEKLLNYFHTEIVNDEYHGQVLPATEVNVNEEDSTASPRIHSDGWSIRGVVVNEDNTRWMREFSASHPIHGKVWYSNTRYLYATSDANFRKTIHLYGWTIQRIHSSK